MTLAVCPGSFDPVTFGHLDVFARAASLFDEVVILVAHNSSKNPLFSPRQRVEFIREEVRHMTNVRVEDFGGLLVDFAEISGRMPSSKDCAPRWIWMRNTPWRS